MHRLARLALVSAFALVVPWSSVFAATTGDPGGSTVSTITDASCAAGVCTTVSFDILRYDDAPLGVCLVIDYSDEAGGFIEQESGCSDGSVGVLTTFAGFMTGIATTQLTVTTTAGVSRAVTVSGAHSVISPVRLTSDHATWEEDGCVFNYTQRVRSVDLTGTVTLDGVAYASDGVSTFFQVKTKVRC